MKKLAICSLLCFLFCGSAFAAEKVANPIDEAFARYYEKALSTPEVRGMAERELSAWQEEFANAVALLRAGYKFAEDKNRVDNYVNACQAYAKAAGELEWLEWSDKDQAPGKERTFGTGAPAAMMMAESRVYKFATLDLIRIYLIENASYQYIFKENSKLHKAGQA